MGEKVVSLADEIRATLGMPDDAMLADQPSIYTYLRRDLKYNEDSRVSQAHLPGGGSEFCRWLGAKGRSVVAGRDVQLQRQRDSDWNPYGPGR